MPEYCTPVWMFVVTFYLFILDRAVSKAVRLSDGLVVYDKGHRRRVAVLCLLYKICCNPNYSQAAALPGYLVPARLASFVVSVYSGYVVVPRSRTACSMVPRLILEVREEY